MASGINNMSQNLGRSLGLAVLTTIEVSAAGHAAGNALDAQLAGYHAGFLSAAVLLAAGAALVLIFLRRTDTARIDLQARSKAPAGLTDQSAQ